MSELIQNRCLVIAEVAQAHDGSLGMAYAYIDAVAKTGADAVKFQTHIAAAESTFAEPWRVKFSRQDATRYDYWKRMEFSEEQWRGLKEHAESRKLIFLSSPFSLAAVELLQRAGITAWKIASGEVANGPMLERMISTRLPMMLSSGMSSYAELDQAVRRIQAAGLDLTIFQCSSIYPTPPEKVGINLIDEFRKRYRCKVGLSDHSGTIYACLAACTLGVSAVEVHVAFSREVFGPDVIASVTTEELGKLVKGIRFIETARANPVDKDQAAVELAGCRSIFTRSVVAAQDLSAGIILTRENLDTRKPGTGIPANRLTELVGNRLRKSLSAGQFINENDIEAIN